MDSISTVTDQRSASLKTNTQAMIDFSDSWAASYRNISEIMVKASEAHFDHLRATLKAMNSVTTVKGAMELQMSATCTLMEQAVANTGKLTTASMEFADQGIAPIKAHLEHTMARFTSTKPDLA